MIAQEQLTLLPQAQLNDFHLEEMLSVNALHEAVNSKAIPAIEEKLQALLKHTRSHFAAEEQMMQQHNYPQYQEHKSEHDRHLHELEHIISYFKERQDPLAVAAYLNGNLDAWAVHHMQSMDAKMADALKS